MKIVGCLGKEVPKQSHFPADNTLTLEDVAGSLHSNDNNNNNNH